MSRRARRIIIPLVTFVLALGVVLAVALSPRKTQPTTPQPAAAQQEETAAADADNSRNEAETTSENTAEDSPDSAVAAGDPDGDSDISASKDDETAPNTGETAAIIDEDEFLDLAGLYAAMPDGGTAPDQPGPLGSLDPDAHTIKVEFSNTGAGIERIVSAKHWVTALAAKQAKKHYDAVEAGTPPGQAPPLPDDEKRLVLTKADTLQGFVVPAFAAHTISITAAHGNTINVMLLHDPDGNSAWAQTAPGRFETVIRNEAGQTILKITRHYVLGPDGDISLEQKLDNRSGQSLDIRWIQYGPGQLTRDRSPYIDIRRFRAAYQLDPVNNPKVILGKDNDQIFERRSLLKRADKADDPGRSPEDIREYSTIWPNEDSIKKGVKLTWFASTNRYFAVAVHPTFEQVENGVLNLEDTIAEIRHQAENAGDQEDGITFTVLYSPVRTIAVGSSLNLDLGIYAGPMQPDQLEANDAFKALQLEALVLYQMSTFCAICTFQWLAHALLAILGAVHFVLADWSIAIIILVIFVRTLLHPITKKSQINMQRFSKGMGALKPEMEKLQKKYPNEPKRLQQEQLKLWRENNISPAQILGCLPMFLQFPIWVALYAGLYFAFDLRQQPAFYGLFQIFGDWQFLADLASPDRFITILPDPKAFTLIFLRFDISSINVLPLLMGVVFFVQQKYMAPPPSPNMSKEQIQQQKIMRVMMVVFMPVVLYSAPSGLILYILTSSTLGVIESKYIRAHIDQMDIDPKKKPAGKKKKSRDPQARAFAEAIQRAKKKRQGPPKSFKKRPKN